MSEAPKRMIVIGGSAGAIEALLELLPTLPAGSAAPVVCVLHLPQDRASGLPELFGSRCARPAREAIDKDRAEPGAIYFAPAGYHLLLETEGTFALSIDEPVNYARPSIDVLFESAARAYGAGLLAILLCGANDDGALGLCAVRTAGGSAWVQDPDSCASDAMPRAAIARAGADEVLDILHMRKRLVELLERGPQ
jgi:two-component system, chemotaxis family, protein-glutamate methylesterase/glutaminase